MKARLVHRDGASRRTFVITFAQGDEPVSLLTGFARQEQLAGCQVTAIGACERCVVGYFDRDHKRYRRIAIEEQAEVLSLLGDIAHSDDGPVVHLHAVLGLCDGTTRGGHLLEASVWPTLELIVQEWPAHLCKRFDPHVGLALIPG